MICEKCFFVLCFAEIAINCRDWAKTVFIKAQAKQKALHTISEPANFYSITVWSDEESETDATEVWLQEMTVDNYIEALPTVWGMDWQKVLKLGMQYMQVQSQQAGMKRAGDVSSRREEKKKKKT